MATHSGILAWRIPWTRGAWTAAVRGVAKSRTRLSNGKPTVSLRLTCVLLNDICFSLSDFTLHESHNLSAVVTSKVTHHSST